MNTSLLARTIAYQRRRRGKLRCFRLGYDRLSSSCGQDRSIRVGVDSYFFPLVGTTRRSCALAGGPADRNFLRGEIDNL